jgi:hypothetical protein
VVEPTEGDAVIGVKTGRFDCSAEVVGVLEHRLSGATNGVHTPPISFSDKLTKMPVSLV